MSRFHARSRIILLAAAVLGSGCGRAAGLRSEFAKKWSCPDSNVFVTETSSSGSGIAAVDAMRYGGGSVSSSSTYVIRGCGHEVDVVESGSSSCNANGQCTGESEMRVSETAESRARRREEEEKKAATDRAEAEAAKEQKKSEQYQRAYQQYLYDMDEALRAEDTANYPDLVCAPFRGPELDLRTIVAMNKAKAYVNNCRLYKDGALVDDSYTLRCVVNEGCVPYLVLPP
jgi:hypothetical protein